VPRDGGSVIDLGDHEKGWASAPTPCRAPARRWWTALRGEPTSRGSDAIMDPTPNADSGELRRADRDPGPHRDAGGRVSQCGRPPRGDHITTPAGSTHPGAAPGPGRPTGRPRAGRLAALGVLGAVALAACSSSRPRTPPPSTSDDGGPTSTSTTSAVTYGSFPLTGTPVHDPALAKRPALSVKVDNAPPARPQAGLNSADVVTEELVEGGLTRFFVTFHSQDAALVGPIRSARPVDADLLHELNGGIFAYSGAAAGEIAPTLDHGNAILVSEDAGSPGFQRVRGRPSPYNVYSSTPALYKVGLAKGTRPAPSPLFGFSATPPSDARAATQVTMAFSPSHRVGWLWDPGRQLYLRVQDGQVHKLADGSMASADDVVILSVAIRGTGIYDRARSQDPFVVVLGSGPCWVLRDGVVLQGTWSRPTVNDVMRLTGPVGQPLDLHPGRTWLELLPQPAQPQL